jgi:hypothetical protein
LRLPQDEDVLNDIWDLPHAEERRRAHLEARTVVVQQDAWAEGQFFHSLSVLGPLARQPTTARVLRVI